LVPNDIAYSSLAICDVKIWKEITKIRVNHGRTWALKLNAQCVSEAIISNDECILDVKIGSGYFWITYDDFQSAIHLEPQDKKYNDVVIALQRQLREGT
jgi:hypothetical protein